MVNANVFLLKGEENEVETSEKRRGMEEKVSAWGEKNLRRENRERNSNELSSYIVVHLNSRLIYFLLRVFLRYIRMGFTSDNP